MSLETLEEEYRKTKLEAIKTSVKTLPIETILKGVWGVPRSGSSPEMYEWWKASAFGMLWKWNGLLTNNPDGLYVDSTPKTALYHANDFLMKDKQYRYHWAPTDVNKLVEIIESTNGLYSLKIDPTNFASTPYDFMGRCVRSLLDKRSVQLINYVVKIDAYKNDELCMRTEHKFPYLHYNTSQKWVVLGG